MSAGGLPILGQNPISIESTQLYFLGDRPVAPERYRPPQPLFPEPERQGCLALQFERLSPWAVSSPRKTLFAVLDAAQNLDFAFAARATGARPVSLFVGKRAWQMLEVAPYFLELPEGSPFLLEWAGLLGNHLGVWFESSATPEELLIHLRNIFTAYDEQGADYFFRYYDPRVLRSYLPTCTPAELTEIFGPIQSFLVENEAGDGFDIFSLGPQGQLQTQAVGALQEVPAPKPEAAE